MKKLMKDKRGGEKLLSIWWIFVLTVVGGGIVLGVLIYNSYEFDARAIESDILAEKIVGCLVEQGELNENFLKENFDIFLECGFNKEVLNNNIFYVNVSLYDSDGKLERDEISFGAKSFEEDCKIEKATRGLFKESKHYPKCSEKEIFILKGEEKIRLYVLAGSNQHIKRITI